VVAGVSVGVTVGVVAEGLAGAERVKPPMIRIRMSRPLPAPMAIALRCLIGDFDSDIYSPNEALPQF
jgi:hypothetical protein